MTEDTQSLPLKDDLSIYTIELPDIPKDLIFPDEINRYFRERIKVRSKTYAWREFSFINKI